MDHMCRLCCSVQLHCDTVSARTCGRTDSTYLMFMDALGAWSVTALNWLRKPWCTRAPGWTASKIGDRGALFILRQAQQLSDYPVHNKCITRMENKPCAASHAVVLILRQRGLP